MLSRAFARAVPRTASRLAATSLRPAFTSSIRSQISRQSPRIAAFSTTKWRKDEHSQTLALKLESEISIETADTDAQAGSDSAVQQFQDRNPHWTLQDTPGEQEVYLKRSFEDENITVHFSIADFDTEYEDDVDGMDPSLGDEYDGVDEGQSGGANTKGAINVGRTGNQNFKVTTDDNVAPADRDELADEEDMAQSYPVTVTVLVQKPGKGALKFLLVAQDGTFSIMSVQNLPKDVKTQDAKELIKSQFDHLYTGPPFRQLDEEVQNELELYLHARGIAEDLATVIPDYIDVKEQREYLGWLNRVKEFVE